MRFRHLPKKHKLAEKILETVNQLLTKHGLLLKAGTRHKYHLGCHVFTAKRVFSTTNALNLDTLRLERGSGSAWLGLGVGVASGTKPLPFQRWVVHATTNELRGVAPLRQ